MKYKSQRPGTSTASSTLRILEVVARLGPGTTAKDITDALLMPPATAYRLLNSLVGDEYLVRTSDLRGFALGHAISGLIIAATPPTVPASARAAIEDFRSGTRFAVHLIMFRNASLRIGDEDADHPLLSPAEMLRYPHASAAGKLMLSQLEDISEALPGGHLERVTKHTITDSARLERQLAEIRVEGVASEVNELEEGFASLVLPVALPNGTAGAALCLTGPAERFAAICEYTDDMRQLASPLAPMLF